jgi:hypothetical protein
MVKTMRQNTQPEKQSLTPMQKQAVLVCIVCALAALLTIGITLVLIRLFGAAGYRAACG